MIALVSAEPPYRFLCRARRHTRGTFLFFGLRLRWCQTCKERGNDANADRVHATRLVVRNRCDLGRAPQQVTGLEARRGNDRG